MIAPAQAAHLAVLAHLALAQRRQRRTGAQAGELGAELAHQHLGEVFTRLGRTDDAFKWSHAGSEGETLNVWIGGNVEKTRAILAVRGKRALNDLLSVDAYVPLTLEGGPTGTDPKGVDWYAPFSVKAKAARP